MKVLLDASGYGWGMYAIAKVLGILVFPFMLFVGLVAILLGDLGGGLLILLFGIPAWAFISLMAGAFSTTLKICEEGVFLQPVLHLKPKMVDYGQISTIAFNQYSSGQGSVDCEVVTLSGAYMKAPQSFSPQSLADFVHDAQPILSKKGFSLKEKTEKLTFRRYLFARS